MQRLAFLLAKNRLEKVCPFFMFHESHAVQQLWSSFVLSSKAENSKVAVSLVCNIMANLSAKFHEHRIDKINRNYDGAEAKTRKSQTSFHII